MRPTEYNARVLTTRDYTAVYPGKLSSSGNIGLEYSLKQRSKWAGICRYSIPALIFVPEFQTGSYHSKGAGVAQSL
jgi:hypothetical protein